VRPEAAGIRNCSNTAALSIYNSAASHLRHHDHLARSFGKPDFCISLWLSSWAQLQTLNLSHNYMLQIVILPLINAMIDYQNVFDLFGPLCAAKHFCQFILRLFSGQCAHTSPYNAS